MLALVTYAFLYTPMKRLSPSAVAVGAVPERCRRSLVVWAAQESSLFWGLSLFALQFLWQFPHFWSIGWLGFEDYANAGYKLMPTNRKGECDSGSDRRLSCMPFSGAGEPYPYMLG